MDELFNLAKKASIDGRVGGLSAGPDSMRSSIGLGSGGMPDLSSLLGPEFKGKDMTHLSKQAETLWKMLDEMAESDPDAYKSFLAQQAEAAAKAKAEEAEESAGARSGGGGSGERAGPAGLDTTQGGKRSAQGSSVGVGKVVDSEEVAMRRLVQGGAPVMVLELQAAGPSLPSEGIKVAILIWSASRGGWSMGLWGTHYGHLRVRKEMNVTGNKFGIHADIYYISGERHTVHYSLRCVSCQSCIPGTRSAGINFYHT